MKLSRYHQYKRLSQLLSGSYFVLMCTDVDRWLNVMATEQFRGLTDDIFDDVIWTVEYLRT